MDARKDRSLDEIIAEWDGHAKLLSEMLAEEQPWPEGFPGFIAQYSANGDIGAHAQDIRGALGLPADRHAYALKITYDGASFQLAMRAKDAPVPPLKIVTERGEHTFGTGEPVATLQLDWYEFLRALGVGASRRSGSCWEPSTPNRTCRSSRRTRCRRSR